MRWPRLHGFATEVAAGLKAVESDYLNLDLDCHNSVKRLSILKDIKTSLLITQSRSR